MKKICFVTATRAEYGLLKPLMDGINNDKSWRLLTIVTGAHLSPEFGLTYKDIERDGFTIDAKIDILLSSDTAVGIVKSMGVGLLGFADVFDKMRPDFVVILGDRYEMLAVASAALIFRIPIVHLHGGEITEGAYDDSFRHSITKMSSLHFVSTDVYKRRVLQLGEDPKFVFNVGAIGIDNIRKLNLLSKDELKISLAIKFRKYNYLVTFHPSTLEDESAESQFNTLLSAIDEQKDSLFIFTKSNADTEGRTINRMIDAYVSRNADKSLVFTSLGALRFLSLLKICDAIVGNSSSGIIEAPSLNTATINIGDRQKGRVQAESVINTNVNKNEITSAFDVLKTPSFMRKLKLVENPYESVNTTSLILNKLDEMKDGPFYKKFNDIL